jgi:hypothetical protein
MSKSKKKELHATAAPTAPKLHLVKEWDHKPVPMEQWGKDHWSTLLYIESRAVDGGGQPKMAQMRQWPGRPRRGWEGGGMLPEPAAYPTRLKNGSRLAEHDDWDCVSDMEAAGLVEWHGTGLQPIIKLTSYGWLVAGALRRHRAEKWSPDGPGPVKTFIIPQRPK